MNKYEYRVQLFEYWNSSNYSWQHWPSNGCLSLIMSPHVLSPISPDNTRVESVTSETRILDICKYILSSNKENVKQKTFWSLFLAQWTLFWVRSGLIWRGLWWNVKFLCVKLCVCCWIKVIIGQLITARPSHWPRVITHHFSQFRDVLCHKLASWHLECAMSGAEFWC